MTNNYCKVVVYGKPVGFDFFDSRERSRAAACFELAQRTANELGGKASVFRWLPWMPEWLGSAMPCAGPLHDWRPNPFDSCETSHPGWTCARCARSCKLEDVDDDPFVGRVPPHKEWEKHENGQR